MPINLLSMEIEGLTDFVTLADCKSFSRAAALRNITQPAFSRRIQALETAVGTGLIDRKNKTFKLTPAGTRFLLHARSLVNLADNAVSEAQSAMTHLVEPVYLIAPSYLSETFFPAWYKAMQKAVPGMTMRLSHQRGSSAIEELRKGICDFALILRAKKIDHCYSLEGLHTRVIGKDKMLAVCARQAKEKEHFLMYERGSYMYACAQAVLGKKAAAGKVVFESASPGLLKEMALAGFGTAVLQESMIKDDLAQEYLKPAFNAPPLECDILLVRGPALSTKKAELLWAATA